MLGIVSGDFKPKEVPAQSEITLNYPHLRRADSVMTRSHKLDDSMSSKMLNWVAQTLGHELCQNRSQIYFGNTYKLSGLIQYKPSIIPQ